jgi:hypothetical protein
MIDVLSTMQVVLREAGYTTRLTSMDRSSVVCFEDDVLTGFACVFEDAGRLLAEWQSLETSLLARYAPSLRAAGEKAWNVYCVFMCTSAPDSTQRREVSWIEEDLNRTRKVAGCSIASREDLVRALLPVLPLQYQPVLRAEDLTERLRARILTIAPRASEVALDDSVSPTEVIRLLEEQA